jgi:hypothetical protein
LLNNDQPERYLVTSALGSWTIRHLLDQGASVVAHDIATNADRLRLFIDDDELARIVFVSGTWPTSTRSSAWSPSTR